MLQTYVPAGLRVLVVDDDPLCLKITEQMLKRCNYEGALPGHHRGQASSIGLCCVLLPYSALCWHCKQAFTLQACHSLGTLIICSSTWQAAAIA
jgi:CheY-like chemotaxis protein